MTTTEKMNAWINLATEAEVILNKIVVHDRWNELVTHTPELREAVRSMRQGIATTRSAYEQFLTFGITQEDAANLDLATFQTQKGVQDMVVLLSRLNGERPTNSARAVN